MKKNLIILTTGLSGSSLLTGFIAKAGYQLAEETIFKNNSAGNYQTFESQELVELNEKLIAAAKFRNGHRNWYVKERLSTFAASLPEIDKGNYAKFIDSQSESSPWLWKDPRLWITLSFWLPLLDNNNTQFIIVWREPSALWESQLEKRIIYDKQYLKDSEEKSRAETCTLLQKHGFPFLELAIEDLVDSSNPTLEKLNHFLKSDLTISDWQSVYSPSSFKDKLKRRFLAYPIYWKNYQSRIR